MWKKTLYILLAAGWCCALASEAQEVSEVEARGIAERFFSAEAPGVRSRAYTPENVVSVLADDVSLPYIYVKGNEGRFVLISRHHSESPIVGYGDGMVGGALPWDVRALLHRMNGKRCAPLAENMEAMASVAPLLATVRTQHAPFNEKCPYYINEQGERTETHCMVGCVATALEEVLTYHAYPNALEDTLHGWKTDRYTIEDIPKGTKIDFAHILPIYEAGGYNRVQADAVSSLCYYCGVAARMDWGLNSSGASVRSLEKPLKRAFGYRYMRHLHAGDYTPHRWQELIRSELTASRPVLFVGYTSLLQGHAFVIDGIDAEGFYHVHWGYGGKYDGYFDLSVLNAFEQPQYPTEAGRLMGNFCNQEALFLHPDSVAWETGDTITQKDNLRVDSVAFSRKPDCNGYVTACIYVRNVTGEPIHTTLELLTFAPEDVEKQESGDCLSLTGGTLAPREEKVLKAYCKFTASGQRVLCLVDNVSIRYQDAIEVEAKSRTDVSVSDIRTLDNGEASVSFEVKLTNTSTTAWNGSRITYSLFHGDYTVEEGDVRQWRILNLAPSETMTDTVVFRGLQPDESYTFAVRNPWLVDKMCVVKTRKPTAVKDGTATQTGGGTERTASHDLNGRRMEHPKGNTHTPYIYKGRIIMP